MQKELSGSTLDADTLDGTSSAGFSVAGHDHAATYVDVTGDTMTGTLTITETDAPALALTSILDDATGDETALTLNYTTNKLTSGADYGLKLVNTVTSSPGASYPLWAGVGSTAWYTFGIGNAASTGAFNASSGTEYGVTLAPNFSGQTGTAGYTGLLVNVTDGGGSGSEIVADFQVGSTQQFTIGNGFIAVRGNYLSATGATNKMRLGIGANSISIIRAKTGDSANATFYSNSDTTNYLAMTFQDENTSGSRYGISLVDTWNQGSGTADNADLKVYRTQTAVGSGAQRLLDMGVGSTEWYKFGVGNTATTGAFNESSGTAVGARFAPVFGTSGTAGWTALEIDATDGAGSGSELLADFQLGDASKFIVKATGVLEATEYADSATNRRFELGNNQGGLYLYSTGTVSWAAGNLTDGVDSVDTGLARSSAGVLKVTDGSTGYGSLLAGAATVGDGTNKMVVSSTGFPTFEGTATYWDDVVVPALSVKVPGTGAPGFSAFKTTLFTYWFDASTDEEVYVSIQMPHKAKSGAVIKPHVHWTPATTADGAPASQTVEWCLEYSFSEIGGDYPATSTVCGKTHSPADANVVADRHYITPLTDITPGTGADGISAILIGRLYRNADDATDDTYEADAGFLSFDVHVECDRIGSDTDSAY